ncbi:hypothetical protein [Roseovarius sp.]
MTPFLVANREGVCIRSEGIDAIWPRDDREPLLVDGKTPFKLPPTCVDGVQTFEEQVGRDVLLNFIDGDPLPMPPGEVPIPPTGLMLLSALAVGYFLRREWK